VTVDVARMVQPGKVVGIDLLPDMVERAKGYVASQQVENVTIQQGNTYELDFADNAFDITYSLNVMVHLTDPVRALREQARVTKSGGLVLANIGDYGAKIFYPACPSFEQLIAASTHLSDPSSPSSYIDFFLGRKALALFAEAGFEKIQVLPEAAPLMILYRGSSNFEEEHEFLVGFTDPQHSLLGDFSRRLLELGVIDESLLVAAREDLARWYAHPHALSLDQVAFWGIGRVK
jgi:SAM-dependent methyltransferase